MHLNGKLCGLNVGVMAIIIHMNYNFKKMFQIMGTSTV